MWCRSPFLCYFVVRLQYIISVCIKKSRCFLDGIGPRDPLSRYEGQVWYVFSMGNNIDSFDQVAHSLFWMVSSIHDVTEVRAVTVEWCFLNPCWAVTNRLFIPVKEVDHLSFHHCFDNLTKHRKVYNCWDMSTQRLRPTLTFPWLPRQF